VIRFKCIYCGQRILAKDDGAGKKGKCPKCKHDLVVPKTTKGRPAISIEKTEPVHSPKAYVPEWEKDLYPSFDTFGEKDSTELLREQWGFLVPTYDSLSVFLMAITWILVLLTNPKTQDRLINLMSHFPTQYPVLNMLIACLVFFAFVGLCFYMVLSGRDKTDIEKRLMAFFAAATTFIIAYAYWIYLDKSHQSIDWRIIFPLWAMINARILLQMLFTGVINEECVSDRQATPLQVFLGLAAVIVIFLFCNYKFKLHWAITFSICTIYTTSFDRALQSVFPGLGYRGDYVSGDEVKP
jgi:DNA-directed RNA polymerase subunit RPC12/RpoP